MLGDRIQFHDRSAIEEWYVRQPLELGHRRTRASIDENALCGKFALRSVLHTHAHGFGAGEASLPEDQVEICCLLQSLLAAIAKAVDDFALPLAHPPHIDTNVSGIYTIVLASPGKIRYAPTRHHGLRRRASFIDASPANVTALDQCGAQTCLRQAPAKRRAALPRADHDRLVIVE